MSGFDVLEQIRDDADISDVPVVIFTGRELSPEEDAQLHTMAREFAKTHPDTLIVVTGDHTHGISIVGTFDDDKPGDSREKVGVYADAGFPNYEDKNGDGFPDKIDVSRRLMAFGANHPDYYETFHPKMDGPFEPTIKNEKEEYVANEAYKSYPGAMIRADRICRRPS